MNPKKLGGLDNHRQEPWKVPLPVFIEELYQKRFGRARPEPVVSIEEYRGWWRIIETSQWVNDELDILGPALISLTGSGDRLRMLALLAYVNCKPTKSGVSFTWEGAWEFDPVSGSGRVTLGKNGRLRGVIKIKDGDSSTFVAERSTEPDEPIPAPPSYRDKWRRRW